VSGLLVGASNCAAASSNVPVKTEGGVPLVSTNNDARNRRV